jgi:hypothetical protein
MVEGIPNRPADGAVQALAVDPTNANIVYAAAVNGGIWKTTDATDASPVWTPLTDQSLPAESMQSIAISPVHPNTIFAGTGSTSSFNIDGNDGFGIVRSTDGGRHWEVQATSTFASQRVRSVVPTRLDDGKVILAATFWGVTPPAYAFFPGGGVYRSTDNGDTFQQVSGTAGSGLPAEGVSDLVADPSNPSRFYAAVAPFFFNPTGAEGVYRSDDGGQTWSSVSNGLAGLASCGRILLSVHNSPGNDVVYAAVIDNNGNLQGVFRSGDLGADWTAMGVPSQIVLHQQGLIWHGAIAADPTNPNVVFIAGDRQDVPSVPNVNGCMIYSGNLYRGDASLANPWQNVCCGGAHGTSPADDVRAMMFDANGNLLRADDGGVYRLMHPDDPNTRVWTSLDTNLGTTEYHSVAFDSLSHVVMGAAQDDGIHIQTAPGSKTYTDIGTGDGGYVAIDSNQAAHPGTSIRYASSVVFASSFTRSTWDANNQLLSETQVGLNIVSGPNAGQNLLTADPNNGPWQVFVLNAIDPTRMLIGTHNIYESFNQGDSLYDLGDTGANIGNSINGIPMVYGGRLGGIANADMFYVASNNTILHRVQAGGTITALSAYPGDTIISMVVDPQNYQRLFVVDQQNRIWATFDEGATFTELTANLHDLTHDHVGHAIEFYASPDSANKDVLLVGAEGGVFEMRHFDQAGAHWKLLGKNLPHSSVLDLHYDYTCNLLLAGTLGRGAWALPNPFGEDNSDDEEHGNSNDGQQGNQSSDSSLSGPSLPTLNRDSHMLAALFAGMAKADQGLDGVDVRLVFPSGGTGNGQGGPGASHPAVSLSTSVGSSEASSVPTRVWSAGGVVRSSGVAGNSTSSPRAHVYVSAAAAAADKHRAVTVDAVFASSDDLFAPITPI